MYRLQLDDVSLAFYEDRIEGRTKLGSEISNAVIWEVNLQSRLVNSNRIYSEQDVRRGADVVLFTHEVLALSLSSTLNTPSTKGLQLEASRSSSKNQPRISTA